jgi:hypothetical protein
MLFRFGNVQKVFAVGDRYYCESWFIGDRFNDIFSKGLLKAIAIAVSRDFWAIDSKIYFLWVC